MPARAFTTPKQTLFHPGHACSGFSSGKKSGFVFSMLAGRVVVFRAIPRMLRILDFSAVAAMVVACPPEGPVGTGWIQGERSELRHVLAS